MYILNGNPLVLDVPFEIDGTMYSQNWLRLNSDEEKAALGIVWVDDPVPVDPRFYNPDGTQRDLEELKTTFIANVKLIASSLLSSTDWAVIKKLETGADVPAEIQAKREATRIEASRLKQEILKVKNLEEFISLSNNQNWPDIRL
jgi:hypothetical protein